MTTPHYEDDTLTIWHGDCIDVMRTIPAETIDAIVTDPPYGLGFMGKAWDALPPGKEWADECLRVLKPGGHVLAFGGSRTWHRLAVAVEDAGFEIRDSIAWLYGSGFPKSRNVSDAMTAYLAGDRNADTIRTIRAGVYEVTTFIRQARDNAGWTNKRIDALFGTNGMAGHWTTSGTQPAVPSVRQWDILKTELGFGDELDEVVAGLAANERPEDWGSTEPEDRSFLGTLSRDPDAPPATGWGTALKPAFEPVVVGRKPTKGTTTGNVRQYGTGGLNIDACRTATDETMPTSTRNTALGVMNDDGWQPKQQTFEPHTSGRWPTNVILDEHQAAALDEQSGTLKSGANPTRRGSDKFRDAYGEFAGQAECTPARGADSGGASRFFPTFRYQAKAPTKERPKVNGVAHPTVKPLELMRWLVRLVTPPDGVVLEPFLGSGTTAEACRLEGFRCIGIERDAAYLPLILDRLDLTVDDEVPPWEIDDELPPWEIAA